LIDGGLRGIFRQHLKLVDWTSIETGITERGVPDGNGCYEGVEFWIEYKKAKGNLVQLRPQQVAWLMKRARHGGNVFVAVRRQEPPSRKQKRGELDELWLFRGDYAAHLKTHGLRLLEPGALLGVWTDGPKRWNWPQILSILANKKAPRSLDRGALVRH